MVDLYGSKEPVLYKTQFDVFFYVHLIALTEA
jgi:hypothetical protein